MGKKHCSQPLHSPRGNVKKASQQAAGGVAGQESPATNRISVGAEDPKAMDNSA